MSDHGSESGQPTFAIVSRTGRLDNAKHTSVVTHNRGVVRVSNQQRSQASRGVRWYGGSYTNIGVQQVNRGAADVCRSEIQHMSWCV